MVNNLYLKRYNTLIEKYGNKVEGFCELHHIIPKCMGGTNEKENLVLVPARVHFILHALLHKAYPDNVKISHAFAMMAVNNKHQNRKVSSRLYEMSKTARSSALKGVTRPEHIREKLRVPKKNKQNYKSPKSEEHKRKISEALKGKKKTSEHIANIWESRRKNKQLV